MRRLSFIVLLLSITTLHAATHVIQVTNNRFTPNDLTIEPGDTVQWVNTQGFHDVQADDASFGRAAGTGWTYSVTFHNPGEILYHCSVHSVAGRPISISMNGKITVLGEPPSEFMINGGLDGVWSFLDEGRNVQSVGMVIDVVDAANHPQGIDAFVGAIFTHDDPGVSKFAGQSNRWFTVQGTFDPTSNMTTVPVFQVLGGDFMGTSPGSTNQVGTAEFTFTGCDGGTIELDLFGSQILESWGLVRSFPNDVDLCSALTKSSSERN